MGVHKATTDVSRPAAAVFAFIADVENEPKWREGVQFVVIERGALGAIGLAYKEKISRIGFDLEMDVEITEVEPDTRMSYTFSGGPFKGKGSYDVVGNGDSCTVAATIDLGRGVVAKTLGAMMGTQLENDLEQLKAAIEG